MDYSTSKEYPNLHVISDKHLLTLSNEKTSHTCRIVNFTSLDKIDAKVLLTIYRQTTTSHPTVIHCDFGVGLTGQMRLIFKALDLMETDHYFR